MPIGRLVLPAFRLLVRMRSTPAPQLSPETLVQVVTWLGVLIGLIVVAALIVHRVRDRRNRSGLEPDQLLANFEEMRSRGDISDADYRKIKSVLGARLPPRSPDPPRLG